jgi:hypothetical protein
MNNLRPSGCSGSLRRLLASTGTALLLMSALLTAAADESALTPAFDGVWVQGNCVAPTRVRLINAFAVTDFLEILDQQHLQIMLIKKATAETKERASAMLVAPGTGEQLQINLSLEDGLIDGVWTRCAAVPAALRWGFGEGVAMLQAMGQISRACSSLRSPTCLEAVKNYMDVSGDGNFGKAEIARGLRGAVFLAAYTMQEQGLVPTKDLVLPMAIGAIFAQWLAERIVEGADYSGDGLLSMEELFQDRGDLAEVMAAMEQLGPEGVVIGVDQSRAMLQPLLEVMAGFLQSLAVMLR